MRTTTKFHDRPTLELATPGHLARYAAEVEEWRLEALAYRAARAAEAGNP